MISKATMFDPATAVVGLTHGLEAQVHPAQHDPGIPVEGLTIGIARMSENSPHAGEMHPDGDETLYLISGRVRVVLLDTDQPPIEMTPGNGLIVPKGTWHRVDILEPSEIMYATPGPNNQYRPL
ncbi:MAG: cupin domain-containing protein [Pseudomonadota bacterium]